MTILTVMPSSASRAIDAAADGLGWSRNTRNPARVRSCSSSAVSAVSSGATRVAMATTRLPAPNSAVEHSVCLVGDVGAAVEDRFGGALGDEEPLAVAVGEHRHATAVVVEGGDGDPVELACRAGGRAGCFPQGDVERVAADRGVAGRGGFVAHESEGEHVGAVVAGRGRSLVRS